MPLPANIVQALVLFDNKNSQDYGLALWAALHEVEQFYEPIAPDVKYSRYYICPELPERRLVEWAISDHGNVVAGHDVTSALDLIKAEDMLCKPNLSQELSEKFSHTLDQVKLSKSIRSIIGADDMKRHVMIITDRAITPPAHWRYIIWDEAPHLNASVISVATLDPVYWRDTQNPDRVGLIKKRMRSVAMSIIGGRFGLSSCDNPDCFMFEDLDSVSTLDFMKLIGPEHKQTALENRAFSERVITPLDIEAIESIPNLSESAP